MKQPHRPVQILAPYLKKEWKSLGIALLATILVTAAELATPVPLAFVVDRLFEASEGPGGFELTTDELLTLAGIAGLLIIGIALVGALASYLNDISLARAAERIVHELRVTTHSHLQRLSLRFHSRRHTGDLVTRVTGDVNAVGSLFAESLATVVSAVLLLAGMIVVSALIDPVLALVAFAVTPLLAVTTFVARRQLKRVSRLARTREGEIASLTAESFAAIREVKAFGSEPYEHKRLRGKSEERLRAGYDVSRIESQFARVIQLIGALGMASVLFVGVFRVARGALTPGELVLMFAYTKKTQRPLRDIARQAGRISRSMARAERITEILAIDDMLKERTGAHDGPPARGGLEFDSVSFSYKAGRPALEHVSLRIEAGTKVALLGRSGAGKSTIAALIARFYDPTLGRVLLDGRDLRDCSLAWLRRQVGLVLQDTVLFSGTVAENIAYGIDARQDEIEAAAKAAGAHGFISQLPEGYETALGPRGIGLSGGQRQRIAIARTLLRDPAILVLDEPTTGLDAESEAQVLDGLNSLMRGRTTIIISHSPRLLRYAERPVSIENGRIVAELREDQPDLGDVVRSGHDRQSLHAAPPRRASVPTDPALPRLRLLLDPDAMAPVLQRSLGPEAALQDVRVQYLRYKPRTNIVVRYDVAVDGRWYDATAMITARRYLGRRAAKPENVALAQLVDGRSPASMPLHYERDLDVLIQWLPLDLELPALAEPPARLLEAAGVWRASYIEGEPVLLAYKPRRRAVLRIRGHVLKIYAKEEEFAAAATGLRAAARMRRVRTAKMHGEVPTRLVTVQPALSGMRPSQPADIALEAGELLRDLHRSRGRGLPATDPSYQLAAAERSAQLVTALLPTLDGRLQALLRELEAERPSVDDLVPSHGDFNARQLLVRPDGLAAIDFDAMSLAPTALDPATYAAYLVLGGPGDLDEATEVLDELLEGYGDHPAGLQWYLATCILRRAPRPFRYLDEHWPERVEGMVAASEAALRS
jgi:ATP-binding cassette subfamily B protein/subfamily B ATP-binding cassette protein MsbA